MATDVKSETIPPAELEKPVTEVPDGGLVAWLQVLGGWCMFFNSWLEQPSMNVQA